MVVFGIIAGVLVAWLILIALVRHEKGFVGITPAVEQQIRFRKAVANFQHTVAEAFIPALRKMTAEIVKVNQALQKVRVLSKGSE